MDARLVARLQRAELELRTAVLESLRPEGCWHGQLSSSALATAVAVIALARVDRERHRGVIEAGLVWLGQHRNADGGWGDCPQSLSNLATTLLVFSAFAAGLEHSPGAQDDADHGGAWLENHVGSLEPQSLARAVLAFYGEDKTFSAPILLAAALAGRMGSPPRWELVPQLPLELATVPHQLFRWLRLPVVSYAIPALIAIGLCRHRNAPSRSPVARRVRDAVTDTALGVLTSIQPDNGGFLEATPLTAFVVMSLAGAALGEHPVVQRGVAFVCASQRSDGSWPIDTNLATWVTTLTVNALAAGGQEVLDQEQRQAVLTWLVNQQCQAEHVMTHAAPGGWSWTDLPGGVPDADDTAGAVLALAHLAPAEEMARTAAERGLRWLLDLQNADGGVPTFCRGWGRLPFDRSCPDITAHALHAVAAWMDRLGPSSRHDRALARGVRYLAQCQTEDGAWEPLWFGSQWRSDGRNPVYGTAQVVLALTHDRLAARPAVVPLVARGRHFLQQQQRSDGGFGSALAGSSSVEETSLALAALAEDADPAVLERGASWLAERLAQPSTLVAAPMGLYFASLWYSEQAYPLVCAMMAVHRLLAAAGEHPQRLGRVCAGVA